MSRQLIFSILAAVLIVPVSFAYDWSANPGDGSEGNPYRISEPNQLIAIGNEPNKLDKNYILVRDIVFDPDTEPDHTFDTAVIGPDADSSQAFYQGSGFSGFFDGDGYAIMNLTIDPADTSNDYLGLFGKLERTARVENLGVEIRLISNLGGSFVGGLCGENTGRITNCYTTGSIKASSYLGGMCGKNDGFIYTSYSTVEITGRYSVGGLCGLNVWSLNSCYAIGNVTGNNYYVGGLCGEHRGSARNCYSAGRVISGLTNTVGGLCGNSSGYFKDSYWDRDTSGQLYSAGGHGKSTSEMKRELTFIGWNNGKWVIQDGFDYPHLAWQGTSGVTISRDYPVRTYAGDGWNNPFEISSEEDLICMMYRSVDWSRNFILVDDIDMSSVIGYFPPACFSGSFDGKNHVISNLTIEADFIGNQSQLGFIGNMSYGGQVRNLFLEQVEISGTNYIGGVCGFNHGDITHCFVTGRIVAASDGMGIVGGICGYNYGYLSKCSASCDLYLGDTAGYCGGLCGWNQEIIRECYSASTIHCGDKKRAIGGFCGINRDIIEDCYSLGIIYGGNDTESVGGFCGFNQDAVSNCYAVVDVILGQDCDEIGGICGSNYGSRASIRDCFWDSEIQTGGVVAGIGVEVNGAANTNVFAKATSQMQLQNTYTDYGWDFAADSNGNNDIWSVCEQMNYPRFAWQIPEGDFVCPNGVGFEDFSLFGKCWLAAGQPGCDAADMNDDDIVELEDILEFISHWLEGK